jgi:hypothetical protein
VRDSVGTQETAFERGAAPMPLIDGNGTSRSNRGMC